MAKVKLNPAFLEIHGAVGDMVFKKRGDTTYVSLKSKRNQDLEPSEAQMVQRKVFTHARHYTSAALANQDQRAFYEAIAIRKNTTPQSVCMGDYLNPPTVEELDLYHYHGEAGDRIRITTTDDVGVVRVTVTLTHSDGTTIEEGQAVEPWAGSGYWEYVATVPVVPGAQVFVEARAYDRPGNQAVASDNVTIEQGS